MSRCGRASQLESLLTVEQPELREHAKHCALCRHELNWLESEAALFRQRAARDEVAHLWVGVEKRVPPQPRAWPRVLVAMAAAVLMMFVMGDGRGTTVGVDDGPLETDALMSPALTFGGDGEACSRLPSGMGFQCKPSVQASVLASR